MKKLSVAHNHIQYDLTIINRAEELFGSGCFCEEISCRIGIINRLNKLACFSLDFEDFIKQVKEYAKELKNSNIYKYRYLCNYCYVTIKYDLEAGVIDENR